MFENPFFINEDQLTKTIILLDELSEMIDKNPEDFPEDIEDYNDPLVLSTEAIEYIKEYRLHNLEENPNDLPEKAGRYLVAYYNINKMPKRFLKKYDGYTTAYSLEVNITPLSYMEAQYMVDKHEFKLPVNCRAVAWKKIDLY